MGSGPRGALWRLHQSGGLGHQRPCAAASVGFNVGAVSHGVCAHPVPLKRVLGSAGRAPWGAGALGGQGVTEDPPGQAGAGAGLPLLSQ